MWCGAESRWVPGWALTSPLPPHAHATPALCGIPPHPAGLGVPWSPRTPQVSPLPGPAPLELPARGEVAEGRWHPVAQTRGVSLGAGGGGSLGRGDAGKGQFRGEQGSLCPHFQDLASQTVPNLINSVVRNTGTRQGVPNHRPQLPDNASLTCSAHTLPPGGADKIWGPLPGTHTGPSPILGVI